MGLALTGETKPAPQPCELCRHMMLRTNDPDNGLEYTLCYYELRDGYGRNAYHYDGICQRFESPTLDDIVDALRKAKTCKYENFIRFATKLAKEHGKQLGILTILSEIIKPKEKKTK